MNLEYRQLLDPSFPPQARVWIYQCSRQFTINEALLLEERLEQFSFAWKSHGTAVRNKAYLFFGRFIILMADERSNPVGGCSTDSSLHFIQQVEKDFQVQLLDRTLLAFVVKDTIELLPLSQIKYAWEKGYIENDTLFFNNAITTKAELEENWIIPVKQSWLAIKLQKTTAS